MELAGTFIAILQVFAAVLVFVATYMGFAVGMILLMALEELVFGHARITAEYGGQHRANVKAGNNCDVFRQRIAKRSSWNRV